MEKKGLQKEARKKCKLFEFILVFLYYLADLSRQVNLFNLPGNILQRGQISKPFPWPVVQFPLNPLDFRPCLVLERGPFGQVLPDQTVHILVGSPLPRTVRVRKEVVDLQLLSHPQVLGKLLAVVRGHRVQKFPVGLERGDHRFREVVRILCPQRFQDAEVRHPVVGRENVPLVTGAIDQVDFEIAETGLFVDDRRPVVDRPLIPYGTASVLGGRPPAVLLVVVPEMLPKPGIPFDVAINRRDARSRLSLQISSPNFRWTWDFFDSLVARHSAFSGSYLLAPPLREISFERPPGEIPSVLAISFWKIPISRSTSIWYLLSRLSLIACPFLGRKRKLET